MGNGLLPIFHLSNLHGEFFARQISEWEVKRDVGVDGAH